MFFFLMACTLGDTADSKATGTFACDTLTCGLDELCIQTFFDPECTNLYDTGASCPDGTTQTMCGGDGHPCCCGPTPETTFTCVPDTGCGDTPSCDCVTCEDDKWCMTGLGTSGREFQCASPDVP